MLRTDLFVDKKAVHVKLDKEVHAGLRVQCFKHNLSMQEILEEFCILLAEGDKRMIQIMSQFIVKKVKKECETKLIADPRPNQPRNVVDRDKDLLYSMIESTRKNDKENFQED